MKGVKFTKKPTTIDEQIEILKSRGVIIDLPNAANLLLLINYYRFCGYGLFFEKFDSEEKRLNVFKEDTTFSKIYSLYCWDEKLRNILQRYLGKIEIAFRAVLNYVLVSETKNPFWYLDPALMIRSYREDVVKNESLEALNRAVENRELSALHFKETYNEQEFPPCWILCEFFSFGKWSRLFGQLKHKAYVKSVARHFKAPPNDFVSWLRALVILRNRCAHHARLWDYEFKIKPSLTPSQKRAGLDNGRVGSLICILKELLAFDEDVQKNFSQELNELLNICPCPYPKALGLNQPI